MSEISEQTDIDIVKFISIRKREIDLLKSDAFLNKDGPRNKSLFQLLPRHMRRRTMGFMRKRLPHHIRAISNSIKPKDKKAKRPTRKYRRRPSNLRHAYEKRKLAGKMWLETHIWHAKRFHMVNTSYGYRLALHDNCKCQRAVYRCLNQHALLHDESYHVCLQLEGAQRTLIDRLNRMCSPETGLTFAARMCLNGKCEGRLVLYEIDKYPRKCLGPARFMWKPVDNVDDDWQTRTIWIWSHPAIYADLKSSLIDLFELNDKKREEECGPHMKKMKLEPSNDVKLVDLKDKMVRFKLIGPLSTAILGSILESIDNDFYKRQADVWNRLKFSISNPNEIPSSTIIGMLVKDPRFSLPKKKSFNKSLKHHIEAKSSEIDDVVDCIRKTQLANSTIWDKDLINELNKSMMSTHQINKLRSQFLLPSSFAAAESTTTTVVSQVPILLVQSSINNNVKSLKNGNLMCGWDLIVPHKWAMAFFLPLVHYGARAIGQNELKYLSFESGNLQFPAEYLDTKSSKQESEQMKLNLYDTYMRRPPSKRVNYLKLAFASPFSFPAKSIFELQNHQGEFFLLRNKKLLMMLSNLLLNNNKKKFNSKSDLREHECHLIDHSYMAIRLIPGKSNGGKFEKFSLLYSNNKENEEEKEKSTMSSIINDYRKKILAENKAAKEKPVTLNKLIRSKFNKHDLLKDEETFHKLHMELNQQPIGFIINSGFTLSSGKLGANAYILSRSILQLIEDNKSSSNRIIYFKTPKTKHLHEALISDFFI